MQITSLPSGYADPTALGPARGRVPAEAVDVLDSALAQSLSVEGNAASLKADELRRIVARYDMTDISPREVSEMLHQLHEVGLLSDQAFQDLTQIRGDLDKDGIELDESLDLVEFYDEKLKEIQGTLAGIAANLGLAIPGLHGDADPIRQRLAWVQKLAAIQSAPEAIGLDELA